MQIRTFAKKSSIYLPVTEQPNCSLIGTGQHFVFFFFLLFFGGDDGVGLLLFFKVKNPQCFQLLQNI